MNAESIFDKALDEESAPMMKVLEDLIRDPRTPEAEIYAYIDFCTDIFATSPHAKQARAAFALIRKGVVSRRTRLFESKGRDAGLTSFTR